MKIQAKHGCEQFWPPKAQLQNWRVGLVFALATFLESVCWVD